MEKRDTQTTIGQLIFEHINDTCVIETEKWALDRVEAILTRFRDSGLLTKDYKVIIPWLEVFTAFTAPGDHIFISRNLFQECPKEEMLAFIIAHEIAHHQLGHLDKFPDSFREGGAADMKILISALYRVVETRIHGPELECDADRLAIDMCVAAGYDPHACLEIFDRLEQRALSFRDLKAVYGPDESDDELLPDAPVSTKIKIWLYQRQRGYLPIRDRRRMLQHHLEQQDAA